MKDPIKILIVAAIGLLPLYAQASGKEEVIFSGKDKFRPNWTVTAWGGREGKINTEEGVKNGQSSVEACFGSETEPFSGITLQVEYGQDQKASAIELTDEIKSKGIVELSLNSGKSQNNKETGSIPLQLSLSFVLKDGKTVDVSFAQAGKSIVVDDKKGTWQKFEIPVADLLKLLPDPSQAVGLNRVSIQYVETPEYTFYVGECVLKTK